MILVAIGANLASPRHPSPCHACEAALVAMEEAGLMPVRCSRWYRSAPQPPSDQPWFVNGVCIVESGLDAASLLASLHRIEAEFGRVRGAANAPRTLDLDLLDVDGTVSTTGDTVRLPHPHLHRRAFVLLPLSEVAPDWRHPVSGLSVGDLIAALADDQVAVPMVPGQ